VLPLRTVSTGLDVVRTVGTGDVIGKRQTTTKAPGEVLPTPKAHLRTTTIFDAHPSGIPVAGAETVLDVLSDPRIWIALRLAPRAGKENLVQSHTTRKIQRCINVEADTTRAITTTTARLLSHPTVVLDTTNLHINPMQGRRRFMAILHINHNTPIMAAMLSSRMSLSTNLNLA